MAARAQAWVRVVGRRPGPVWPAAQPKPSSGGALEHRTPGGAIPSLGGILMHEYAEERRRRTGVDSDPVRVATPVFQRGVTCDSDSSHMVS